MAALRNTASNLTRLNIARAHRRYTRQPTRAVADQHTTRSTGVSVLFSAHFNNFASALGRHGSQWAVFTPYSRWCLRWYTFRLLFPLRTIAGVPGPIQSHPFGISSAFFRGGQVPAW